MSTPLTPDEIYNNVSTELTGSVPGHGINALVKRCMVEYTSQETAAKDERIKELEGRIIKCHASIKAQRETIHEYFKAELNLKDELEAVKKERADAIRTVQWWIDRQTVIDSEYKAFKALLSRLSSGETKPVQYSSFKEFWKEIVCNPDGSMNEDQVKKELHDFFFVMEQVPKVYCHITNGRLSYLNYHADTVIRIADDCLNEAIDEAVKECEEIKSSNNSSSSQEIGHFEASDLGEQVFVTTGTELPKIKAMNEQNNPQRDTKPKNKKLDERGFIFRGGDNRIYLCKMWGDTPWFFYFNTDGFLSLRQVNQTEIWIAKKQELSEDQQQYYQQFNPGSEENEKR